MKEMFDGGGCPIPNHKLEIRNCSADGRVVKYTYDAGGNKLTMATTVNSVTTTTDYVNGFVYTNGNLAFFGSPEGRVVKNGSNYEYQYAISDHQGNTRVVFTSNTPTPVAKIATFEGNSGDNSSEFTNVSNVYSFTSANNTPGGNMIVRMNQNYSVGPAKSLKVYPGDAVDMEVYAYYESASGYGTTNVSTSAMILNIASGLTGGMAAGPDKTALTNGINAGLGGFGIGGNQGDNVPAAYLNYILFDANYNPIDAGWQAVTSASNFSKQKVSLPTKQIKEAGYIYVYLSYENQSNNYVYFDDFKVTHTPTNVIQYNEYYPFGLQTASSWTRENNSNNFLYNEGSEMNATSGLYDLPFRNYDAALGRFFQVDPLAAQDHNFSPFAYGGDNPIVFNDPSGLMRPYVTWQEIREENRVINLNPNISYDGGWSQDHGIASLQRDLKMNEDAWRVRNGIMDVADYAAEYGENYTVEAGGQWVEKGWVIDSVEPSINGNGTFTVKHMEYVWRETYNLVKKALLEDKHTIETIENWNKINDWASAYTDIPGLAVAITSNEIYADANLAYKSAYNGAYNGLAKVNTGFRIAGATTGVASIAFATYLAVDKYKTGRFNTSTAVDLGISTGLVVGGLMAGTASAPFVIAGGLVYGIARIAAGDEIDSWIDSKFDSRSLWYGK